MSSQIYANSQLMYYPTDPYHCHRMVGTIGKINIGLDEFQKRHFKTVIKEQLGEEKYKELYTISLDNNVAIEHVLYDYFLKEKLDLKYFNFEIYIDKSDKQIVIADLQAGEGNWLNTFDKFLTKSNSQKPTHLIANELEEGRYHQIEIENGDKYLGSSEDLQLPKECISLLLFNPPYGESNGERNVKRYLRMTLERQLIAKSGYILMVIRKDDALDITDLLAKHFYIYDNLIYKTDEDEYSKYKQYIILARLWHNPLDEKTIYGARDIENNSRRYKDSIEKGRDFCITDYNNKVSLPGIEINELMENFQYVNKNTIINSNKSSVWKWIKDISEIKDLGQEKLILPKSPKSGEIANLLASGYISGELSLKDGSGTHIAVGGTKTIESQEIEKYTNDNGDKMTETKTIRYSKPYLNILVSEDGKLKIKELGVESN